LDHEDNTAQEIYLYDAKDLDEILMFNDFNCLLYVAASET